MSVDLLPGPPADRGLEDLGHVVPEVHKKFQAILPGEVDRERRLEIRREIHWRDAVRERSEHRGEHSAGPPDAARRELTQEPNPAPNPVGRWVAHWPAAADGGRKEPGRDGAHRPAEWDAAGAESDVRVLKAIPQRIRLKVKKAKKALKEKDAQRAGVALALRPQVVARQPEDVSGLRGPG
ncbi:MAG: hypothetical protein ABSG41_28715 [Bryobacteraceae bacterium]